MRLTHEAQVIPSTGKDTISMWVDGGGHRMTPGERAWGPVVHQLLPVTPAGGSTIVIWPLYMPIEQVYESVPACSGGRSMVFGPLRSGAGEAEGRDPDERRTGCRVGGLDRPRRRDPGVDRDVAGAVAVEVLVGVQRLLAVTKGPGGTAAATDSMPNVGIVETRQPDPGAAVHDGKADDHDADESQQGRARRARHDDRQAGERQEPGAVPIAKVARREAANSGEPVESA